jgi:hypothetical protein
MVGGAPAGSSRTFRLDPFTLPVRFSAVSDGEASEFVLDHERALLKRPLRSGSRVTVTVPVRAYAGVAVRMEANGQSGGLIVVVELMHRDPALSLPLIVADEPEDVAADWQAWGRALNLPLLVVTEDGTVRAPVDRIGALVVYESKPRRRYSFFADRRPRFLARRKPGRAGPMERLTGREIIAPE